jgi:PAS domain S-box-containing protein
MKDQNTKEKKRNPPWILGLIVLISLTLLVLLQSSNVWKNLSVESASDTLLLYALSSLNFFAFVIFGFIFIRSILKLARERRALQLGSKLKMRLLIYFIAISILPTVAMAGFSYLFMNRAIERWFTQIPENVVRAPIKVQEQALAEQNAKLNETANMLVQVFDGERETPDSQELRRIAQVGNLTRIEIISPDGKVLAESGKLLNQQQKTELEKIVRFVRDSKYNETSLTDGIGFDATFTRFSDGRMLIIVPDARSDVSVNQLVENTLQELDRLKGKQNTIRQIGFLTLGVLTFLLIFASSWTAFYVAKGLTRPIRALAEGADEIARGNLGHRVEVLAEDELEMLVSAFNQMSETLARNSAELSERRKYIETVLQSLSTGVISFDSENRVTTINKAAIQIFKLEDADFENIKLEKLVSAENFTVLEKLLNRARRIGKASEQTVLQREQIEGNVGTNESLPLALSAAALSETDGDKKGVVLVIEDLSELIAAQRASAWQEVARRMAHEIKNPLTPIQLSAERIAKRFAQVPSSKSKVQSFLDVFSVKSKDQKPKTEDQNAKVIKDGTETILREVQSLKAMVDEFSRFARLPNAKLESGNLNEIVKKSAALYEDREAKIELNLAENLPNAMIDEEQLKRVFVNLIENATEGFDETQEDKIISLKTFHDSARDLIVAEVSDNGKGIKPSDFQKLFQPYFSTKGRGTGLGLAIVQRIVSEHRGKIKAVNNSPKGAKFIVELPVIN